MKIVQINTVAVNGSTGRIAEAIGKAAIEAGHESYIAYGRGYPGTSASQLIRIGNNWSVYEHVIATRLFDRQGLESRLATKQFLKQLDTIKPDIVHLHNLHGYFINYPLLLEYLKDSKAQVVATLHDFWWMTGHCAYINDSCNRWTTACKNCPRLNSYPAAFIDHSNSNYEIKKRMLTSMDNLTIVPVSYWLQRKVDQSFLKEVNSRVIENGIDISEFYPDLSSQQYFPSDKITLLFVATRWTGSNGYHEILQLSSLLDDSRRIIMVGVDAKQKQALPANVIGIERTENLSELRRIYSHSDYFVNLNSEVTFGLVTAEAMACGTTPLVLKGSAGEDIIDTHGYTFENIKELANLVNSLEKKQSPNMDCVVHIKNKYQKSFMLKQYFDLYIHLLSK